MTHHRHPDTAPSALSGGEERGAAYAEAYAAAQPDPGHQVVTVELEAGEFDWEFVLPDRCQPTSGRGSGERMGPVPVLASWEWFGAIALEIRMSSRLDVLEAEALKLLPVERSHLLERLVASLDSDPEVEAAWEREADRREAEVESGSVAAVPGHEAIARRRRNDRTGRASDHHLSQTARWPLAPGPRCPYAGHGRATGSQIRLKEPARNPARRSRCPRGWRIRSCR